MSSCNNVLKVNSPCPKCMKKEKKIHLSGCRFRSRHSCRILFFGSESTVCMCTMKRVFLYSKRAF